MMTSKSPPTYADAISKKVSNVLNILILPILTQIAHLIAEVIIPKLNKISDEISRRNNLDRCEIHLR